MVSGARRGGPTRFVGITNWDFPTSWIFTRMLQWFKGEVSLRKLVDLATLPCCGFVSDFDHEISKIGPIRVAFFASEDKVRDEPMLEGFHGG